MFLAKKKFVLENDTVKESSLSLLFHLADAQTHKHLCSVIRHTVHRIVCCVSTFCFGYTICCIPWKIITDAANCGKSSAAEEYGVTTVMQDFVLAWILLQDEQVMLM